MLYRCQTVGSKRYSCPNFNPLILQFRPGMIGRLIDELGDRKDGGTKGGTKHSKGREQTGDGVGGNAKEEQLLKEQLPMMVSESGSSMATREWHVLDGADIEGCEGLRKVDDDQRST